MRILILGPSGQIGYELAKNAGEIADVVTAGRSDADIILDPLDRILLDNLFTEIQPNIVINAIAYTAVDKAESEPEQANLLNAQLPSHLAELCVKNDCLLIHYSTDFVFDGSQNRPWLEDDATSPLSVYGKSKLAGEKAIEGSSCTSLILRTSWVYGERGNNFLLTMLRLGRERDSISVVGDQIGSPSSSHDIAYQTLRLCKHYIADPQYIRENSGIYHLTSLGETSWYGFAKAIFALVTQYETLSIKELLEISTDDYPTDAIRPAYSVLNCRKIGEKFSITMPDWQKSLQGCIQRYYN